MKVKQQDTGNFVTVYNEGQGKTDGILLDVIEDMAEVWYPHLQNETGGNGLRDIIGVEQIVTMGPSVAVHVPLF